MYHSNSTLSSRELREYFRELPFDFEFRAFLKKRNKDQNKFYWGFVIRPLSEFLNAPKQQVHELMKHRFLVHYQAVETVAGEQVMPYVKSTTTLSGSEFETYCRRIRDWALTEL